MFSEPNFLSALADFQGQKSGLAPLFNLFLSWRAVVRFSCAAAAGRDESSIKSNNSVTETTETEQGNENPFPRDFDHSMYVIEKVGCGGWI